MKKILLFTFSLFSSLAFSQKYIGINSTINHQAAFSSGIQVGMPVYTFKNKSHYNGLVKLFAGTGLNYVVGSGKTFDVPVQVTGKLISLKQLYSFKKSKLYPYVNFGAVVRFQETSPVVHTISQKGESIKFQLNSPPVNSYLKFGAGVEKEYFKISLGTNIHLLSGMMFSDFRDSKSSLQHGSMWRNMLLGADLYMTFHNLKKFKPKPPCKCYFD